MKRRLVFFSVVRVSVLLALAPLGCTNKPAKTEQTARVAVTQQTSVAGQDHAFDNRFLEIARSYERYPRTYLISASSLKLISVLWQESVQLPLH
jgi:hypothetical protein